MGYENGTQGMSKESSESESAEMAAPASEMSVIAGLRRSLFERSPLRRKQAAMLNAAAISINPIP